MFLSKTKHGTYIPSYPADHEESGKIKTGEEVRATRARNPKFHRLYFALIKLGFENQSKIDEMEIYRQIVQIKAGHYVMVEGKGGVPHPIPKSISFDKIGQSEFEELYKTVLAVICAETKTDEATVIKELENFM